VPLFWLTYRFPISRGVRYPKGRVAGVVVLDAPDLLQAELKGAAYGKNRGLELASGHQIDPLSAERIPANMISRFLDPGDLRNRLLTGLLRKKPPAPSVRRLTATKRKVGKG
jgi:hypothetical protein